MTNTPRRRDLQAGPVKPLKPSAITLEGSDSWVEPVARLIVEYADTTDMNDGQPLPPLIVDGVVWHVVRRLPSAHTRWRRIWLSSETATDRRRVALRFIDWRQTRRDKTKGNKSWT